MVHLIGPLVNMKNEQYFCSIYWLMLISASTNALLKNKLCFLTTEQTMNNCIFINQH